ncbi:MAG: hypothetical protein FWF86_03185 [Clostridia bacterium]|nr:hypothetical protein [Clostridia bacterium]
MMKKIGALLMVLVLIAAFGTIAAHGEVFNHPAGAYTLTIPDGWMAIDGALAEGLLAMGLDVVEYSDSGYADWSGDGRPEGAVIMLFDTNRINGLFRNSINISITDLGQDFSTDAILSRGDGFVGYMQSMYEGFNTTVPISKKTFGALEAVVLGGEFVQDGQKAVRQAIFSDEGILYTITLFANADQITECEPIFAAVIVSMRNQTADSQNSNPPADDINQQAQSGTPEHENAAVDASAIVPGNIAGAWRLILLESEGRSIDPVTVSLDMSMVLNEDDTATVRLSGQEADKHGRWAIINEKIYLLADGNDNPMVFTPDNGNLVIEEDGMKLIFGKEEDQGAGAILGLGNLAGLLNAQRDRAEQENTPTDPSFIGEWRLVTYDVDGISLTAEELELSFVLTFGDDGKVEIALDGDVIESSAWSVQGGVAVFENGEETAYMPDKDKLIMTGDEGTMIFERMSAEPSVRKDDAAGTKSAFEEMAGALVPPSMDTQTVLEPGDVIGSWTLDVLEIGGTFADPVAAGLDMSMLFNEDYSAIPIQDGQASGNVRTWSIKDGQVILSASGDLDSMVLTPVDGNLVVERDGAKLIFGKAEREAPEVPDPFELPDRSDDSGNKPLISQGGPTRLKNYEDWLQPYVEVMPMQNMLEQWISTEDIDDSLVQDAISYPRAWPAELLGGAIPEYTGDGWLYDLFVTRPNMSYAAKDITYLALTIYEYGEDDLGAYIENLASFGYGEVLSGGYYDSIVSQYKAAGEYAVRCFQKGDCFVSLTTGYGEGGIVRIGFSEDFADLPFLDIGVNFLNRGSYTLNSAVTPGTGLLNFEQAGRPGGVADCYGTALDNLAEAGTDQYGRQNTTLLLPSAWPVDVFGELIPEYVAAGVLGVLYRTEPGEEAGDGRTLLATLYIQDYQPGDVNGYIEAARAFGYRELPASYYADSQAAAADQSSRYQVFKLPGIMLTISESSYKGNDELSIGLSWEGRSRNYFASPEH